MKKIFLITTAVVLTLLNCQNPSGAEFDIPQTNNVIKAEKNLDYLNQAYPVIVRAMNNKPVESKSMYEGNPGWWSGTSLIPTAVEGGYHAGDSGKEEKFRFLVDDQGFVFVSSYSSRWYKIFGISNAVDVTSNGNDTYAVNEAGSIFKLRNPNTANQIFDYHTRIENKTAVKLDVNTNGELWVLTEDSCVYKISGINAVKIIDPVFTYHSAIPQDVGCSQGDVYIAAALYGTGTGLLYKYDESTDSLIYQDANAYKVDVDDEKTVYIINQWGELYKRIDGNSTWEPLSTLQENVSDIGA